MERGTLAALSRVFFSVLARLIANVILLRVVAPAREMQRVPSDITLRLVAENLRYFYEGMRGKTKKKLEEGIFDLTREGSH